eukprot:gene8980-10635_t
MAMHTVQKEGRAFASWEDPGVQSVKRIYKYFKQNKYKTIIMAASFRNTDEILELAGCDNITISPVLMSELEACTSPVEVKLHPEWTHLYNTVPEEIPGRMTFDSPDAFDRMHSQDTMAVEKLREGVAGFCADQIKLEEMLLEKFTTYLHP